RERQAGLRPRSEDHLRKCVTPVDRRRGQGSRSRAREADEEEAREKQKEELGRLAPRDQRDVRAKQRPGDWQGPITAPHPDLPPACAGGRRREPKHPTEEVLPPCGGRAGVGGSECPLPIIHERVRNLTHSSRSEPLKDSSAARGVWLVLPLL